MFNSNSTQHVVISSTSHVHNSDSLIYAIQNFERNAEGLLLFTDSRFLYFQPDIFGTPLRAGMLYACVILLSLLTLYWLLMFILNVSIS